MNHLRPRRRGHAAAVVLAVVLVLWPETAARAVSRDTPQMGPVLAQLVREYERRGLGSARALARLRGVTLRGELVPVVLEPRPGVRPGMISRRLLQALGGRVDAVSRSYLRVLLPLRAVRRLESLPGIRAFRAPDAAIEFSGLGSVVSESVSLTHAAGLQAGGLTGAGVRVGVVDLGFRGLAAAIAAGELPADTIGVDFTGTGLETGSAHGVGVAEHVLDMAPGVELHCLKVSDVVDLENAADYLRAHGIQIANHSVGWAIGSYYDDTGPINRVVNDSRELDGVFWTVAAGNQAQRHWRGRWLDANGNGWLDFAPGDDGLRLTSSSSEACVYLNWGQYEDSVTDLDLFVYDADEQVVASSEFSQSGPQIPAESVCFPYDPAEAPYRLRVLHYDGPTSALDLTLFSFYNNLQYATPGSSLMDPAAARGAFAVGAVHRSSWTLESPMVAAYSSQGPTTDGRPKPDLVAPDGTSSLTYGYRGAYGTSFSSPTVAGAAALLLEAAPGLAADELDATLRGMALDIGATGPDPVTGAGKLELAAPVVLGVDSDGDGVLDAEDNCLEVPNAASAPFGFQTTTGGQLDDDADGYGNACDADFDQSGGSVASTDFALFKQAFGKRRTDHLCGAGGRPCDVYDLDGRGPLIDSADFARFRERFGHKPGPRCPLCPLTCVGDACPQ